MKDKGRMGERLKPPVCKTGPLTRSAGSNPAASTIRVNFAEAARLDRLVCERKRQFKTEGEAREAGSVARSSKALYTYRCRTCKGWHLTSSRVGQVIMPSLKALFPASAEDFGDFEHDDDELFAHLHNYGWGR